MHRSIVTSTEYGSFNTSELYVQAGKTPKDYFEDPEKLSVMKERQRVTEILEILEKKRLSGTLLTMDFLLVI